MSIREELKKIDAALMAIGDDLDRQGEERSAVLDNARRVGYDKGYNDAAAKARSAPGVQAVKEAAALLPRDVEHEDFVDILAILLEAIDEL